VRAAVEQLGAVDAIVNNAGISVTSPFPSSPRPTGNAFAASISTARSRARRAAFVVMRAAGRGGRIVNVTSGAALDRAYPGTAAYAAAKGGVVALTRVIAAEGAAHGITCNAVAPLARTRMSAAFLAGDADDLEPDGLAPLVVYLASAASATVSGAVFCFRRGRIALARERSSIDVAPAGERWTADEIARRIDEILAARDA
jgi:NAD(P)-dependent dehydrogenase (short-subunit alcohol dehydrogenase family)